jgi:two-component system, OmpR family, phosphate regulon sensor histidine kinase PhoR
MDKRMRVLLVEDNVNDAVLVERELQKDGHSAAVVRVDRIERVREELARQSFDLVISDFALPGFNGLSVLSVVREIDADIPFILVSGAVEPDTAVAAMRTGAQDYIMKGDLGRLLPAVDREVGEALVRRQRRNAESGLRESEQRYRLLLLNLPDAVLTIGPTGCITFANAACLDLLGIGAWPGLFGRALEDFVAEEDEPVMHALLQAVTCADELQPSTSHSVRLIRADRHVLHTEIVAIPFSPDRQLTQLVIHDVTERTELEQLKDDFISTVSHELRTPLTTILGCTTLLEAGAESRPVDERRALATKAKDAAERMRGLVEDLLQTLSLQSGDLALQLESTDMVRLVSSCIDVFAIAEIHQLVTDLPEGLKPVSCDQRRLMLAVSNLIANAVKFSPDGGRLWVTLSQEGDTTRLAVRDEGVGIDPADLETIFSRFRQADMSSTRSYAGFGLGLFIVKSIVEAHGGRVHVDSVPGSGSTFTIEIPTDGPYTEEQPAA